MDDMRNMILSELIDKMHGRLADKMYPEQKAEEKTETDAPAETVAAESEAVAPADDEMSDSDIDEILKSC